MGNDKERPSLQLAAMGWDHPSWENEFYPHDLPEQWRLTYYANEFCAVLVPQTYWQSEAIHDMAQWYENVPTEFRFYIQLHFILSASPDGARILQSLRLLKEKLAGFILDMPKREAKSQASCLREQYPDVGVFYPSDTLARQGPIRCWCDAKGRYAGQLDCTKSPDLKSLRLFIEQFIVRAGAGEGTLFINGDITCLRDAGTIAQLLGY